MPPKNKVTTPVAGSWKSEVCDCCQDPALSCCVFWCNANAAGQVYQRFLRKPGTCCCIATLLWFFFIATPVMSQLSQTFRDMERCNIVDVLLDGCKEDFTVANIVLALAFVLLVTSSIFSTYIICTARKRLRERDRIPDGSCGATDDCCASYWCQCCTLVQMLRQDKIDGSSYQLCTPEAV